MENKKFVNAPPEKKEFSLSPLKSPLVEISNKVEEQKSPAITDKILQIGADLLTTKEKLQKCQVDKINLKLEKEQQKKIILKFQEKV